VSTNNATHAQKLTAISIKQKAQLTQKNCVVLQIT